MSIPQKHRKLLIISASVVLVLFLIVITLPFLIDANRFRPEIENQLQTALGRKVQIGNVHLSLLSGGVNVEKISIADDPAFGADPFLTAKSLDVGVEILPLLFSKAVRIDSITLRQPQVRLIHSDSGKWNFSSLGASTGSARSNPNAPSRSAAKNVSIGSLKIVDGRVLVSSSPRSTPRTYDDVQLTARNISYSSVIPFSASAKTPGSGELKLDGKAGPINRANADETPLGANIVIKHMDLGATGFIDPASGLAGNLDFDGTVNSDGKIARTQGKVKADKLRLVRTGSPARQPVSLDYATDYDLRRQSGTLTRGDVRVGSSAAKITGNYQTQRDSTLVNMKLNAANMPLTELQGLLPAFGVVLPGGSSFQGGNVNADLAIAGPVDRLVTTGPLNISNARLTGFNLASKMATMSALTGMKTGSSETLIEMLSSNLRVAPEGIKADNLKLVLPQIGTVTGNGTVGANNSLNFKMLAKLSQQAAGSLGGISALSKLGGSQGEIPFIIQGTTSNPVFVPDVGGAVGRSINAPGKDVGGMLQGLFGKKKPQ